ncbi:Pseudouridine-5'-phosphate glycosidase [Rubrobacter xylanophilus DSM 9941]|uniref:pseudouridine-5'-phosphate glycosidase n=1 Tax=Rubrobacter xylanophilus TaxID=49319 RepID=UPI001C63D3F2|nr:pseudouridine-5'-phosphate glycosidase [Rubrobacter xylanophilus]QYJ16717.1 Pseudouridine-5'-phosphate glycosidase [Rubrobacter xylanophilus DSM 9941]
MRPVQPAPEVAEALQEGRPVVALESTLISHGLPRPDNLRVARALEEEIRREGAVPATVGVVEGVARVGLGPEELELLASGEVPKLSARDLPAAAAKGVSGATTVAATAHLAALCGIKLFATGGLGGVHRGARESWDVSADLAALSRTPVAVVCSGVKSILDVPATLEQLETLGVPVVGFRSRAFAGFYLTDSGCTLDWSVEDEEEAAALIRALPGLGLGCGVVISNPLPPEEQLDPGLHERALRSGLEELARRGISGKEVTPFLLEHFRERTGGESLRANERLVLRNGRLAARIARRLCEER